MQSPHKLMSLTCLTLKLRPCVQGLIDMINAADEDQREAVATAAITQLKTEIATIMAGV